MQNNTVIVFQVGNILSLTIVTVLYTGLPGTAEERNEVRLRSCVRSTDEYRDRTAVCVGWIMKRKT